MKLLLLVCLSVVFALVAGCDLGYYYLNKSCTDFRDCASTTGALCQHGKCCQAAPRSCPAGMRATEDTCNIQHLCPSGQYRCVDARCCKLQFCSNGFTKTNTACTSSSQCGTDGSCLMGICCVKDTNTCPPEYLDPTKTCMSTENCESGALCIYGNCCQKAELPGLDKFMDPITDWQCDDLTPCPSGYYCRAKRCAKPIRICDKPYYNVGRECSFSRPCERSTDKCSEDTGNQCCREYANSCPNGYQMKSYTCDTLNPCPHGPAGSPYTCIEGRCCDTVLGGCPGIKYYTGNTCMSGMTCPHPADSCESGMCCRNPAPGCPHRHYSHSDESKTCNLDNPCPPQYQCIRGRCCLPATCPHNYLETSITCTRHTQCGTHGYCQLGRCCHFDTAEATCMSAYKWKQSLTCSGTETCPYGSRCYSKTGKCCEVSPCPSGYNWSSYYCSRYKDCPTDMYCNEGRCCKKI